MSLFKHCLPRAEEQVIPKCQKSNRQKASLAGQESSFGDKAAKEGACGGGKVG